jgi:predicted nucleotidyltransferase
MGFDITLWEEFKNKETLLLEKERKKTLVKAKRVLKQYFKDKKVKKVFIIGSILKKGKFYPFSDIDIVVEELGERYFKVLRELEEFLGRNVDLIEHKEGRVNWYLKNNGLRIK